MSTNKPRSLLRIEYEEAAEAYLRSLPLEHFMEATAQATQRKITLESLDLVQARRPEVRVFNELYRRRRRTGEHNTLVWRIRQTETSTKVITRPCSR